MVRLPFATAQPVELLKASVSVSSAQILALFATPVTVVASPGANAAIIPVNIAVEYLFSTGAYTDPNGTAWFWGSQAGVAVSTNTIDVTQAASYLAIAPAATLSSGATTPAQIVNQPIVIQTIAANPTGGGGSLRCSLAYYVARGL